MSCRNWHWRREGRYRERNFYSRDRDYLWERERDLEIDKERERYYERDRNRYIDRRYTYGHQESWYNEYRRYGSSCYHEDDRHRYRSRGRGPRENELPLNSKRENFYLNNFDKIRTNRPNRRTRRNNDPGVLYRKNKYLLNNIKNKQEEIKHVINKHLVEKKNRNIETIEIEEEVEINDIVEDEGEVEEIITKTVDFEKMYDERLKYIPHVENETNKEDYIDMNDMRRPKNIFMKYNNLNKYVTNNRTMINNKLNKILKQEEVVDNNIEYIASLEVTKENELFINNRKIELRKEKSDLEIEKTIEEGREKAAFTCFTHALCTNPDTDLNEVVIEKGTNKSKVVEKFKEKLKEEYEFPEVLGGALDQDRFDKDWFEDIDWYESKIG